MSCHARRQRTTPVVSASSKKDSDDLTREFAQLEKLIKTEEATNSEEILLRAEKRYIQYELIVKPLARKLGFKDLSPAALHQYKKQLFHSKKYQYDPITGKEVCHVCHAPSRGDSRVNACQFQSLKKGNRKSDPLDVRIVFEATGEIYVCTDTLVTHVCGTNRCKRYTVQGQGILVCNISGLVIGTQYSVISPGRWARSGAGVTDGGEGGEYDLHEGDAGIHGETGDDDDDQHQQINADVTLWPPEEHETVASLSGKKRKQQQQTEAFKKLARDLSVTTTVVAVPVPIPVPIQLSGPTIRSASVSGFQTSYYSGRKSPAPSITTHKFARGSVADLLQQHVAGGGTSAKAWYGKDMIDFSVRTVKLTSRNHTIQICYAMLYHTRAKNLFDNRYGTALSGAERETDDYYETCTLQNRMPNRFVVYGIYWQHIEPLFPMTVSRVLSSLDDADSRAGKYLCDAIVRIWKICEATP